MILKLKNIANLTTYQFNLIPNSIQKEEYFYTMLEFDKHL